MDLILSKQNDNIFQFLLKGKIHSLSISKDNENTKIIFSISSNETMNHMKSFEFTDFEKLDNNYFKPFKNNIEILYKFLIRLSLAKLVDIKIGKENKEIISLNLCCLLNNKLRPIRIDIPSIIKNGREKENQNINEKQIIMNSKSEVQEENNKSIENEEYNEGSAPVPFNNRKQAKYKLNNSNKNSKIKEN